MIASRKPRSDSLLSALTPDQQVILLNKLDQESYENVIPWLKEHHGLEVTPSMLSKFRSRQKTIQTFDEATLLREIIVQLAHSQKTLDLDNARVDRLMFLPFELKAIENSDFQTLFQIHRLLLDKRLAALKERQIALEEARLQPQSHPEIVPLSSFFIKTPPSRKPRFKSKASPISPQTEPPSNAASPLAETATKDHTQNHSPAQPSPPTPVSAHPEVTSSLLPEVKSKVIAAVFPPPSASPSAIAPLSLPEAILPENTGNFEKNPLRAKVLGIDRAAEPIVSRILGSKR